MANPVAPITSSPPFVTYGSQGEQLGQFIQPLGIFHDEKNHRLLVSEGDSRAKSNRIQIITLPIGGAETKLSSIGQKGSENGNFKGPKHLAVEPQTGNILVADCVNGRGIVYSEDGKFVKNFGVGDLDKPFALGVSRLKPGHVVVGELDKQAHIYQGAEQKLLRSFAGSDDASKKIVGLLSLAVDDTHKRILLVDRDHKRISIWAEDGSAFIEHIDVNPSTCYSVAVGPPGMHDHVIAVGTSGSILLYDARKKGEIVQTVGSKGNDQGQFESTVYDICLDSRGTIWTTDYYHSQIHAFLSYRVESLFPLFIDGRRERKQPVDPKFVDLKNSFVGNFLFDRHVLHEIASYLYYY